MPITNFVKHKSPTIVDKGYFEVIDNGDGTVTIAENQTFQIQDVIINTSDFSLTERTLAIPLGFNGQIRFSLCGESVSGYDESNNIGKFYIATFDRPINLNHFTDLGLCSISRDATTGTITISGNHTSHSQYFYQAGHAIVIDGTNGDDSNPGTHEAPIKTVDKLLDLVAPYQTISILFAAGTYTFTKPLPSNISWYMTSLDSTNPATIISNVSDSYGLISLFKHQWVAIEHMNIDCNGAGVIHGEGCGLSSYVSIMYCTITLNVGFGYVANWCWPVVNFYGCTIIKPSIGLLWQQNATTLDVNACTIQDGAGNPLTVSDVVYIVRDTNNSIRNFLSITIK